MNENESTHTREAVSFPPDLFFVFVPPITSNIFISSFQSSHLAAGFGGGGAGMYLWLLALSYSSLLALHS